MTEESMNLSYSRFGPVQDGFQSLGNAIIGKHSREDATLEDRSAKHLRPSDPDRMTDITPDSKVDQEEPIQNANLKLFVYQTPFIYAFPTSLAVVKQDLFNYDCTPWLSEPLHDLIRLWRFLDFAYPYRREGESATPKVHFGTTPEIHIYAVFPHLETIGKTAE